MKEFQFGAHRLQVDVEGTRGWYDVHGEIAGGCDCDYCRNFAAAIGGVSSDMESFLAQLGLDFRKPGEVMEWCREADGRHWYAIQYHLVGTLLEKGERDIKVAPGITGGFAVDMGPFLKDFPEPFFNVTWT